MLAEGHAFLELKGFVDIPVVLLRFVEPTKSFIADTAQVAEVNEMVVLSR
jgi:hypothetical protein